MLPNQALTVGLALLALLSFLLPCESKREYVNQFPPGSEHWVTPPIALFSIYMGKWNYPHTELLFESMRWNPMVDYIIIYIVPSEGIDSTEYLRNMAKKMEVHNLHIVPHTLKEWNARVKDRLGIDVTFTSEWFYKLCDYKPTLAHMFPELVSEDKYSFWGYGDMDVIWGNFSRFSYWFNGDYKIVISGWFGTTGAAAFYENTEVYRKLFMQDNVYVPLLKNQTYHNLDEGGTQVEKENVVDNGSHSISEIQKRFTSKNHIDLNRSHNWKDHCFLDEGDAVDWAGAIVWYRGSLKVLHGSPEFPPGRELLFFHRPHKHIDLPTQVRDDIIQEMIQYGYLLPSWVPLLSKHKCRKAGTQQGLTSYKPYDEECFPHAHEHNMHHAPGHAKMPHSIHPHPLRFKQSHADAGASKGR